MTNPIRIVLVDPTAESRDALVSVIDPMDGVWLAEVCVAYEVAWPRIAEIQPDVALIVTDADPEAAVDLIRSIVKDAPEVATLPMSRVEDGDWILGLIRAGAGEFLPFPTAPDELLAAFQRLAPRAGPRLEGGEGGASSSDTSSPSSSKIIAVTGASGEMGCTTLAVNLATTLAKHSGKDVALADFDLLFGSVDTQLDLRPETSLQDLIQGGERLDSTLLRRMLARHSSGLHVLARPVHLHDAAQIDPEGLRQALTLLTQAFPLVVVDTSKSLQASDFLAFEAADTILIVIQLEASNLRNTARLLECFRQVGDLSSRVRVVANRVGSQRAILEPAQAAEILGCPISWQIPNATKVFHPARDRGIPIDMIAPKSDAQRAILAIARGLVPFPDAEAPKSRLNFFRDRSRPR